jgi:hypothetical protein
MAAAFVGVAGAVRLMFVPLWANDHAYIAFYPAVMLAAYIGGRRSGAIATGLSAVVGWWAFSEPAFSFVASPAAYGYTLFFTANCVVAVLLISSLRDIIEQVAQAKRRADDTAQSHAEVFRELNERVSSHLQMVSGLLSLQADTREVESFSNALDRASAVSLFLARVHRDMAGGERPVEFLGFARALLAAKLQSLGEPPDRIVVQGQELEVLSEQATSLGVAVLECCTVFLDVARDRRLVVELDRLGEQITLRFVFASSSSADLEDAVDADLLRAVVRQVGGQLRVGGEARAPGIEISFGGQGQPQAIAHDPQTIH